MGDVPYVTDGRTTLAPWLEGWSEPARMDVDTGPNAADHLLERGLADDPAIIDRGRTHNFDQLRRAVDRLASELVAQKIPAGSRVGILGPNSFFWVAAYLAGMQGHVVVPLSDKGDEGSVRAQAERVGCRVVFLDRRFARRFAGAIPEGTAVITDACLEPGGVSYDEQFPPAPVRSAAPQADALLLFTSGTTAAAKVVRLTHRNIVANTESIVDFLGLTRRDRMLVVLPFYYCFGLSLLNTHLRVGGSVSLCPNFVFPEVVLDQMERDACTGFAGVPSNYQLLARASTFGTRELPSLRLLQQAGGKLPPAMVEELVRMRPHSQLFVMYGQTEATARLSYLPPEMTLDKPGSVGRAIPGVQLRVLDEGGRDVVPGEVGEIYARGANISPGYLDDEQASASKFPHGLLRTGDLATVDEDGTIYVVDRVDDFIKSWGHRISSQEIEACVMQMPELVAAAAVGVPDPEAGEAVSVVIAARPGSSVSEEEVLIFTRTRLPRHMIPRSVFVVDALPLNANGKVDKHRVRELCAVSAQSAGPIETLTE